jgi:hypothetical protein
VAMRLRRCFQRHRLRPATLSTVNLLRSLRQPGAHTHDARVAAAARHPDAAAERASTGSALMARRTSLGLWTTISRPAEGLSPRKISAVLAARGVKLSHVTIGKLNAAKGA